MADVVTAAVRSRMMAGIRSANTTPELAVRSMLHRLGFRFGLNSRRLIGSPDVILPKYRVVIFVHGCFWHQHHGCRYAKLPKSNRAFWLKKFEKNVERDAYAIDALRGLGWRVLIIWECQIRDRIPGDDFPQSVSRWIKSRRVVGEFPVPVER